jgi:acyl carrier protein
VPVHERLEEVFRLVFDDDTLILTDQTMADDIPGWDSLAHINLMFSIEDAFGVRFAGNELAEFANIGELKRFLAERAGDAAISRR